MAPTICCLACRHDNDPWRKYCGGCGGGLPGGCGTCAAINAQTDAFCGGCGTRLREARARNKKPTAQKSIPNEATQLARGGPRKKPPGNKTVQIDVLTDIVSETSAG